MDSALEAAIAEGFDNRDRDNMAPTIAYFTDLLDRYPGHPAVLYELGGSYDTAGQGDTAEVYYLRALDAGLGGDRLRRCLLQYGSTLRNLERYDESLRVFDRACEEFPESPALRVFRAITLFAADKHASAVGELLDVIADADGTDIARYEAAIRGNADYLRSLDDDAGR